MLVTNISLKNRLSVFVLMVIIIIAGFYYYLSLPTEAAPDVEIPYIIISTPYFGVSPEDIENLVTRPIERKLKGLADVKEIRSTSQEGYSMISVEFVAGTDIDFALQKVREKVDLAKSDIPEDAEDPILSEINLSDLPIMLINVSGKMDLVGLKKIAEDLEDEIETIPGVIDAIVTGGLTREVQVNIDPDRLFYYNIAVDDVIDAIRNEHITIPGGTIDLGTTKYLVRVPGEFKIPEKMKDIVVKVEGGRSIFLRNLAEVVYSFKEKDSISRLNGAETVSIAVQKRSGTNLLEISDQVKALLKEKQEKLPAGIAITITGDQSIFIRETVKSLENNIICGLILIVGVLFVVMGVRNAFLVGIAIPLSMLLTFLILGVMGQTINMVILFALILAVGMLVDNAIVIVENIYRHHQEGRSIAEAASVGTQEVGIPVIASTVTTVCAFIPLIKWPGIIGEFMAYLPKTVILTLSCSLFVALIFNPTVCSRFMRSIGPIKKIEAREEKLGPILRNYLRLLRFSMKRPLAVFAGSSGLLVLIIVLYAFLGRGLEFFPRTDPEYIYVDVTAPSGTNLETSNRLVKQIENIAESLPDIEYIAANVGHQGQDMGFSFGGGTPNKSRIMIDMIDMKDRSQPSPVTRDKLRHELGLITGADIEVNEEEHGPPTGAPINIEISGEDYSLLGGIAKEVNGIIREVDGAVDIKDDFDEGKPELRVTVDRVEAALLGINTWDIASTVRTAVNGTEAAKYRVGEDEYDITVRFALDKRSSIEDLRKINIFYEGEQIPLSNIAKIEIAGGLGTIQHKDMKRMVTVEAKVEKGYNENAVREICKARLAKLELPTGYFIESTGADEEQQEAQAFLSRAFAAALMLISLILISQFNSLILPFIIMFSVILSMIGVLIGLMVTGTSFGIIMTGIGVISLAGVVVNNSIVLLDYVQKVRMMGFEKKEAIIQAGLVRFRPVMLTAITTILGLIPLTTGYGFDFTEFSFTTPDESSQWWGPMGVAVIFGLAFATLLTLVVVPTMYKLLTDITDRLGIQPAYIRKMKHVSEERKKGSGVIR
ncbi:MAG TPA: efflux RND transporter permease subunit [archaeon]|nr:efflux RND transporter permease subunit [archaeon]